MKNALFFCLFFLAFYSLTAQNKAITLEEIWSGAFTQEGLQSLQSLNNGQSYIVQGFDRAKREVYVDIYDYKSGRKTGQLFNSGNIDGLDYFQTFSLSQDESLAILSSNLTPVYRYSAKGNYFVLDLSSKKITSIDTDVIQEPHFSPDNQKIAFVKNNNIYINNIGDKTSIQVTKDGEKNKIINGVTDWVYEEEFAVVKAFEWSSDGKYLAYLKFDESQVPEFSMDLYGRYGKDLYPNQSVFKYPKAGENNAIVSLHLYDVDKGQSTNIDLGDYHYIPRIQWTNDNKILSVQTTNRHQNILKLHYVNATNFSAEVILTEKDKAYVEVTDNLTFLEDNSFIWTSEKDGRNHIYQYNSKGKLINQVTKGDWEVTNYYGYNESNNRIYYQSTESGSINRGVYSINIKGNAKKALAVKKGTNDADFSADFTYFINTFSSVEQPNTFTLHQSKTGKVLRDIKDNNVLQQKLKDYSLSKKELNTISVNGNELNMWMIKPFDFDPSKKYPLLLYQYSGPGSQMVSNSFGSYNDYWHQMLANKGYIIACVDGRGTGYKGRDFKKRTQLQLGKYELEDQIAVAKKLGQESYIDKDRIGIWGWSYGGFMSSNAIFQANDVFSLAIAVAPVTSWRFYDTVYTERFMTTPQENPSGYDNNSPITHINSFKKGKYLLIHGSADDNVHVQNTMQLVEALIQANKQFDWRIYPDKNHGIYGGNTRLHLYQMMTDYIVQNL